MYSQISLKLPLLETIEELGGEVHTKKVYSKLADKFNLSAEERDEKIQNGSIHRKWDRTVRWVKENLKLEGLIESPKRGIWALTEKAKAYLNNAKKDVIAIAYEVVNEKNETVGIALWGEVQSAKHIIENGMVNAIITSPPYPLVSPMDYGNVSEREYVEWFRPIAEQMYNSLAEDGSLVLNLGPVFMKGMPVKSNYKERVILMLCDELGFYRKQDFFWHNPSKLPTSNWVTRTREMVVDSIENIFWLSKNPHCYSNNRNVLNPYSETYKQILNEGGYKKYLRPSGHKITHFNKDNGGRIPCNLFTVANSASNSKYHKYCKENNILRHPARFPIEIPTFFIKLLTKIGNVVWDTFSGSGATGEAALKLGRKFILSEKSLTYLQGSLGRFDLSHVKKYEPLQLITKNNFINKEQINFFNQITYAK